MLKKTTPRHKEIMRRLIVGETISEAAISLGMSPGSITRLLKDPIFATELKEMEKRANEMLYNSDDRLGALETIKIAADESARLCRAVVGNKVPGVDGEVALDLRVKTAWDILDRAGHGKVQKTATLDLTALILEAAKQRDDGNNLLDK